MSVAAKAVIALLFWLYGARLSPQQAWQGVQRWRLHLLVLATTFVVFPVLGLAARGLVPWLLNLDLYNGLLFLCLVPSTVQSSIAFTSIARGNVSAALVSASLSNIVGVALTPLLVVLLMDTSGAARMDAAAIRDIVLQLLLPFALGQLLRPWIADWIARHAMLTKAVERGSILLIVYTAFSMGVVEHIWRSVDPWQLITVAVVDTALLMAVLAFTRLIGGLVGLDRGDAIVLLFCGSKKGLASGLPMALVFFPGATVGVIMLPLMIFHQIQLVVCSVTASRLSRDDSPTAGAARLVAADVDRMGSQQRQRLRLTSQHPAPQIHPRLDQNVRRQRRQHNPVVALDLALELADRPARISGEDPHAFHQRGDRLRVGVQIDHHHPAGHVAQAGHAFGIGTDSKNRQAQRRITLHRSPDEHRLRFGCQLDPLRQHVVDSGLAGAIEHHSQRAPIVVLDDVNHAAAESRLE